MSSTESGRWRPDAIQPTHTAIRTSHTDWNQRAQTRDLKLQRKTRTLAPRQAGRLAVGANARPRRRRRARRAPPRCALGTRRAAPRRPGARPRQPARASLGIGIARDATRSSSTQAKRLGVAPKIDLSGTAAGRAALARRRRRSLRKEIEQGEARRPKPEFGTPESVGVDQSTLDAIAACESGGDPTAVDASGTYHGKYQFDLGTWASVGGSGDPAAAPEAEQDYRAALLMSQAGSSPWPVCG